MLDEIRAVIRRIPPGRVATYGQIADLAGFPGRARQVVWALRGSDANGVPWHRVLGAQGKIRLPGESGLEQHLRLRAEGVAIQKNRVDLTVFGWDGQNSGRRKKVTRSKPGSR